MSHDKTDIRTSMIVAMAENRVIGRNNDLIWHIPEDLKHFKRTTMGKPMVMGRKSYESIGKPLPGRISIVISRNYQAAPVNEYGPYVFRSLKEGIDEAKSIAARDTLDEIFVTGGGEIYRQALPLTDRLYLTVIHRDYDGDTTFPDFDRDEWTTVSKQHHEGDPAFTFYTLERKVPVA